MSRSIRYRVIDEGLLVRGECAAYLRGSIDASISKES